jgi:hypothetical protein
MNIIREAFQGIDMETIPVNLRRLVEDVLPKGFHVAQAGDDQTPGYAYFYILDADNRRRTFSHAQATLDELYGEIRKLSAEVRRLDYWKRKAAVTDEDIDALVESVCTNLPKLKGCKWGYASQDFNTPCCATPVPAGSWWIHEEAGLTGQVGAAAGSQGSPDACFATALDFARYLIERKESRFERSIRQ